MLIAARINVKMHQKMPHAGHLFEINIRVAQREKMPRAHKPTPGHGAASAQECNARGARRYAQCHGLGMMHRSRRGQPRERPRGGRAGARNKASAAPAQTTGDAAAAPAQTQGNAAAAPAQTRANAAAALAQNIGATLLPHLHKLPVR